MPYATYLDIINRFKPITTFVGSGTTDVATTEVQSVYVYDSEGIVDSFLQARYTTPVTPVPPLITAITSDLTIHKLFAEKSGNVPEWMDKRYDRAMELLKMLRDGEILLPSSASLVASGDNFAWSSGQGYHPIFSPVLGELNQTPDSDLVESEINDRETDPGIDTEQF